jgi:hypothetical protein
MKEVLENALKGKFENECLECDEIIKCVALAIA